MVQTRDTFLNTWPQILLPGRQNDAAFYNFYTVECGTITCPRGLRLAARVSNFQRTFT